MSFVKRAPYAVKQQRRIPHEGSNRPFPEKHELTLCRHSRPRKDDRNSHKMAHVKVLWDAVLRNRTTHEIGRESILNSNLQAITPCLGRWLPKARPKKTFLQCIILPTTTDVKTCQKARSVRKINKPNWTISSLESGCDFSDQHTHIRQTWIAAPHEKAELRRQNHSQRCCIEGSLTR